MTQKTIASPWAGWFSGLPEFELLERQEGKTFKFNCVNIGVSWICALWLLCWEGGK